MGFCEREFYVEVAVLALKEPSRPPDCDSFWPLSPSDTTDFSEIKKLDAIELFGKSDCPFGCERADKIIHLNLK